MLKTVEIRRLAAVSILALATNNVSAKAQTFIDNFNRPDGDLGANYSLRFNNVVISNGTAVSPFSPLTPNLVVVDGVLATTAAIDVANRSGQLGWVALSLGYRAGFEDSFFVKVQDNDGNGTFDAYAFRRGVDDTSGVSNFALLGSPFTTGTIEFSQTGTVGTLAINSTSGFQTYSFDYGFTPGSQNVGFGVLGNGTADNFRAGTVAVPGPVAGAGLIPVLGLAGAWYARRRKHLAA